MQGETEEERRVCRADNHTRAKVQTNCFRSPRRTDPDFERRAAPVLALRTCALSTSHSKFPSPLVPAKVEAPTAHSLLSRRLFTRTRLIAARLCRVPLRNHAFPGSGHRLAVLADAMLDTPSLDGTALPCRPTPIIFFKRFLSSWGVEFPCLQLRLALLLASQPNLPPPPPPARVAVLSGLPLGVGVRDGFLTISAYYARRNPF